ncbi:hypothetical protein BX600DRAFT_482422 [Xylariales sp. PMI_506]|nr:hypothetical protein BX600DRAFT_482422 [Xylariales sp. PMI_506]
MSIPSFLYSQLFVEPAVPEYDFSGQTIIITGGNAGLGLEAARLLLQLKASRIILGVRSLTRGAEAVRSLLGSPDGKGSDTDNSDTPAGVPPQVQLLPLDLEDYASVQAFASSVNTLDRVDGLLLNAGKITQDFYLAEGNESTLTVNVTATFLLLALVLPALRRSATRWGIDPRVSIVSSDRHVESNLPEWREKDTFAVLNDPNKAHMDKRYHVSKLLQILLARVLAERLAQPINSKEVGHTIIVNTLTPGMCRSGLVKNLRGCFGKQIAIMTNLLARTTEVGSRTLVHAIAQGPESHGKYMNDGEVQEHALSAFVRSEEGRQAGIKMWEELMCKLEVVQPNIRELIGRID